MDDSRPRGARKQPGADWLGVAAVVLLYGLMVCLAFYVLMIEMILPLPLLSQQLVLDKVP